MRLFVAINLPEEVRTNLLDAARLAVQSLGLGGEVRWVPPENLHLTLKFLGELPENRLPGIHAALEAAAERHEPFAFTLAGLGGFPSLRRARVVWAGVSHGRERLRHLAEDVDGALARGVGTEPEDRGYKPHITLGRSRRSPMTLTGAADEGVETDLPGVRGAVVGVEDFELMKSEPAREPVREPARGGVRYTALGAYPLIWR